MLIEELRNTVRRKGYLAQSDILDAAKRLGADIVELDRAVDALQREGMLLRDDFVPDERTAEQAARGPRRRWERVAVAVRRRSDRVADCVEELLVAGESRPSDQRTIALQFDARNAEAIRFYLASNVRVIVREAIWFSDVCSVDLEDLFQEAVLAALELNERRSAGGTLVEGGRLALLLHFVLLRRLTCLPSPFTMRGRNRDQFWLVRRHLPLHECGQCAGPDLCPRLVSDIRDLAGVDEWEARDLINACKRPASVEQILDADASGAALSDKGRWSDQMSMKLDLQNDLTIVQEAFRNLKEKERRVLYLRFGVGVDHDLTLEEIAAVEDLTRERVRQIESLALVRLERALKKGASRLSAFEGWAPRRGKVTRSAALRKRMARESTKLSRGK